MKDYDITNNPSQKIEEKDTKLYQLLLKMNKNKD